MNYNKECKCGKHVRRLVHREKESRKVEIPLKTCGDTDAGFLFMFDSEPHPDGLCEQCDYYRRNGQ